MSSEKRILLTGAAGNLGSQLTQRLAGRYTFVLSDIREPAETHGYPFMQADIAQYDQVLAICRDIDTIVHLAADPRMDATWESLLPRNVVGVYNVFEAAREAGCRRVIFASSVNAVFGYPPDLQVQTTMPVRPINLYGATKAWGEAVAHVYAHVHNISAICLRFGWVVDRNEPAITPDHPYLDITLTYEDLAQLIGCAIDAPDDVQYGVFHGISNNRWKRLDISETRRVLGFDPHDDAFVIAGMVDETARSNR